MSVWIYTVMCLSWLTTCPGTYSPTGLYDTKAKCIEAGIEELKRQHRPPSYYAIKCDEVYRIPPAPGRGETR